LADYRDHYAALHAAGAHVVAISVDTPERSERLRRDLDLAFPILSDTDRHVVKEWNVFNPREHGGIAKPSVFIVDANRKILFESIDSVARRVTPANVLAALQASNRAEPTHRHAYVPRPADFARALRNYFR
jgi:peroxiredoxin